jgi:hypothetical protein
MKICEFVDEPVSLLDRRESRADVSGDDPEPES